MNPLIQLKNTTPLILLALVCFGLLPIAQSVVPPPDGGYPGGNTAEGQNALLSLNVNTGTNNTAVGWFSLISNVEGQFNTAVGAGTLFNNTAHRNTAIGGAAMFRNTMGSFNTAVGMLSLFTNSTGSGNTAIGDGALFSNTTVGVNAGNFNTAVGADALSNNTVGTFNSGFGQGALASNNIGLQNAATGAGALFHNTQGSGNTANGFQALNFNNVGSGNTAIGFQALEHNTTGFSNIAVGLQAGRNPTMGDFNIDIGNLGGIGDSNTIRIGDSNQTRTFIAGISGVNQGGTPLAVTINASGQLGTQAPSSRRFKKEIKPMEKASEAILALQPVTFHYKSDNTDTPQFGLIAEEVAKVNPNLVVRDKDGEIYTVRYEAVNAMLLNEFLKANRKIEAQQKQIEALTAGLQKVRAHLEASKPAPQVVNNP
jgi:hypothetical protein